MESLSENRNVDCYTQGSILKEITTYGNCNNEKVLSSPKSISLSSQDKLKLSSWNLPERVFEFYVRKGITEMFQWQLECLTLGGVLDAGNLVYSAPTSAGKTLVAEILISKTIFESQKKALVVLPFVSVVREKMFYFQGMYSSSGIQVEGYMGGHSPSVSFKQVHLAICTIEKANSIINKLLDEQGFQDLGLVVVDELHLLGDPYRGYLLELLLTKLKYISCKSDFKIQIVGMSATLPNLKSLADWLQADLYYTDFRPVPLQEKLKCEASLYDKDLNKLSDITLLPSETCDDSENIGQLCLETIANGHSILIFCPTKVWCENLAEKIAMFFRKNGCSKSAENEGTPGWILRKQLDLNKINEVIEHLKMCPVGLDADLCKTVTYGVAFHHAGLTLDERDIIEGSFRQGCIRVLCATSTLSSGVNLPARRVIIRTPMSFGGIMDVLTYRQMIGRAGRMGVDSEGESILICKPSEKSICQTLMRSNLKPIDSCLGHGRLSASLKRALLEIIASGIACNPEEVEKYANCTFLASSTKHNIKDPIKSCIEFLEEQEFIRLQEGGSIYTPTPLGKACLASSLPPDEGLALFRELQRARRCFVLDTDLHIIYQVTPYSVSEQWSKLDWLNVLTILESLPQSMKRVGEMVGVEEGFLVRIVKGIINTNDSENRNKLSIHRRFYTALALQDLVNEISLSEVAKKYECNKGMLQSLQQSAATYAGMVTEFTKCLGWSSVELIFSQFQERLQFGVRRELCELMRLPLLNAKRARVLFNSGFTSLSAVANANIIDLENAFFSMVPFQSKKEIAGETTYDKEQRNKLETVWVTGKADLTIRQAAEDLLKEARNILQLELGLEEVSWGRKDNSRVDSICESQNKSSFDSKHKISPMKGNEGNPSIKKQQTGKNLDSVLNNKGMCNSVKFDRSCLYENKDFGVNGNSEESFHVANETDKGISSVQNASIQKTLDIKSPSDFQLIETNDCNSKELNNKIKYIVKAELNDINGQYDCQVIAEERNSSKVLKEELNFTSSYIFDMIPNHVMENCDNIVNENCQIDIKKNFIKDSDSVSSDPGSNSSVEVLSEIEIQNDSKALSFSRLSEDIFDRENDATKKMSTPLQFLSFKTSMEHEIHRSHSVDISSPDIFCQSLTFDTQIGKALDFDEPQNHTSEDHYRINPSSSLNSDDLGFVSDLSPQKCHQRQIHNIDQPSIINETNEAIKEFPQPCFKSPALEIVTESMNCETGKRKAERIDSPDLILDSDESSVGNLHLPKKVKCSASDSKQASQIDLISGISDSDDEILPTPKTAKVNESSFKRLQSHCATNVNRSIGSRCSQRTRLISQNLFNSKFSSISLRKQKNDPSRARRKNHKGSKIDCDNFNKEFKWDKLNIIDVCENKEKFRFFCDKLKEENIISFALGCRRKIEGKKQVIGARFKKKKCIEADEITLSNCLYKEVILDGIGFYWYGNDVYYMSLEDEKVSLVDKIELLKSFCGSKKVFRAFDVKEQLKMLQRCCSVFLNCTFEDPKVGFWLLCEIWKEKNFISMAQEYFPQSKPLLSQIGSVVGFSSPGLLFKSSVSQRTRACIECFLSYHMVEKQLPLMLEKRMEQAFVQTEMPVIKCLAEMELAGFRISRIEVLNFKEKLETAKEVLEGKAYALARQKFSLSSSVVVSKVLLKELALKEESITLTKKRKLPSTSKEALQNLAKQTKHPLPEVILHWRKIRSILSKFVAPLLQISSDSDKVFGVSQTYTVTGRISMHEPNLQNIPRDFIIEDATKTVTISLRNAFVASENCLLVSADYCQIELRMLAHLSADSKLIKNIVDSQDIFVSIAAYIFGIPPYEVDEDLRQRAKQTCYGIIYGMGPKVLGQSLNIEETDAIELIENFKTKYPGVTSYLEKLLSECRKTGYVSTLLGRRRYLPAINDANQALRTEAERQAVNTTIQGSAADLLKTAMVTWRQRVDDLILSGVTSHLVLHLHDELIFEVQKDVAEGVANILKETMEDAVELIVPTPVKIKMGLSWGQLHNIDL